MGTGAAARGDAPAVAGASPIHLAGTGSFALEVLEYARAAGRRVIGLIELVDPDRIGTTVHGLPVIGPQAVPRDATEAAVAVGGDRTVLWAQLSGYGWTPGSVIHPLAAVSPSSDIGGGAVIGPLAVLGARTRIGEHGLVGRGALIGHHAELQAGVVVNPGANIGGNSFVGEGTQIGMGATVLNALRIGSRARVAAGAVVVRDVPDGVRVQGVPARVYGAGKPIR
jgi:sugar O-acyltransferase (sialic acid O-acetyltransferase NeuD family)